MVLLLVNITEGNDKMTDHGVCKMTKMTFRNQVISFGNPFFKIGFVKLENKFFLEKKV